MKEEVVSILEEMVAAWQDAINDVSWLFSRKATTINHWCDPYVLEMKQQEKK